MEDNHSSPIELDRRSLLKHASAASSLALFGTAGATARDRNRSGRSDEEVLNELVIETDDHPELEHASITFLQRGRTEVVRGEIQAQHELDAPDTHSADEFTKVSHSLSLSPELAQQDTDVGTLNEETIAELETDAVVLERTEETADPNEHFDEASLERENQLSTHGLDDPDFDHLGDAVTYVETSSSECGPLCRTNLVVDVDRSNSSSYEIEDSIGLFETVSGSTCDGEEFGDRFPCANIPYIYDCSIPDSFNTNWYTDDWDYDLTSAEADYYNNDFPVIPKTTAEHSQDTSMSGTTIEVSGSWEHSGTYGFRTAIRTLLKGDVTAMYY